MTYQVRTEKRHYLLLTGSVSGYDHFVGVVEFKPRGKDAELAVQTAAYEKESLAKAQATKLCKRYQAYFDREGERWEVLQRQKREAKQAVVRMAFLQKRIRDDFAKLDRADQLDTLAALRVVCPE